MRETWYEVYGWVVRPSTVVGETKATVIIEEPNISGTGVSTRRATKSAQYFPTKLEALDFLKRKATGYADFHQRMSNEGTKRLQNILEEIDACVNTPNAQ